MGNCGQSKSIITNSKQVPIMKNFKRIEKKLSAAFAFLQEVANELNKYQENEIDYDKFFDEFLKKYALQDWILDSLLYKQFCEIYSKKITSKFQLSALFQDYAEKNHMQVVYRKFVKTSKITGKRSSFLYFRFEI